MATTDRRRRRRTTLAVVAALLVATLAPAASAGTQGQLDSAKRRLAELRRKIRTAELTVDVLQRRIDGLGTKLHREERAFQVAQVRMIRSREALARVEGELELVEVRLADRAFSALWMGSPSSMELVFGADSFGGALDRMEFLTQLQIADENLAEQIRAKAEELAARRAAHEGIVERQARRMTRLDARRDQMLTVFQEQQQALGEIMRARREAQKLIHRLRIRLTNTFGGERLPFGTWAELFLTRLKAPACRENQVAVVAWQAAEFTSARWNPLATTLPMPGSWSFNSVGVQNFVSLSQGLEASKLTLMRGYSRFGYGPIVQALRRCADAMTTAQAINASGWCRGCAGGGYVTSIVPVVERYFDRYAGLAP